MSARVLRFTGVLSAVAGVVVFQASGYGPRAATGCSGSPERRGRSPEIVDAAENCVGRSGRLGYFTHSRADRHRRLAWHPAAVPGWSPGPASWAGRPGHGDQRGPVQHAPDRGGLGGAAHQASRV